MCSETVWYTVMRENTIRSQSSVLVISEREIFLYNFDNVNRLMGEHNKRRYKSGISAENPFYTGRMVPANLREKPPIEIRDELSQRGQDGQYQEESSMRVTGGYRNKNLNNVVSSQLFDTQKPGDYTNRAQYYFLTRSQYSTLSNPNRPMNMPGYNTVNQQYGSHYFAN